MTIVGQLNQLNELDMQIEKEEQSLNQKLAELGSTQVLDAARTKLASDQQQFDDLKKQQKSAEHDIEDIAVKIKSSDKQLYGGKISNPKELTSLQEEVRQLKARRDQLETDDLAIIDRVEAAEKSLAVGKTDFQKLDADWHLRQNALSGEIEELKSSLSDLKQKRQSSSSEIEPQSLALYERIRKQKKTPIARVEQGICRACRISLSASQVQRIRSGAPIQCGSCGRILFLP
jgi:uncharacterized protein